MDVIEANLKCLCLFIITKSMITKKLALKLFFHKRLFFRDLYGANFGTKIGVKFRGLIFGPVVIFLAFDWSLPV